jgi:hypothetical protein
VVCFVINLLLIFIRDSALLLKKHKVSFSSGISYGFMKEKASIGDYDELVLFNQAL